VKLEILKQRLIYEQLDNEKNEKINNGKFRYFTNLSHEFRTPLTLISGPLERIVLQNKDVSNTKYLTIIEKNTKRLLSLVDQLITFQEAEDGVVKLNLSQITFGGFLYPTTDAFEDYAIEKNINFFYKIGSPNDEIIIDIEKVERILFNLLSNAFKNTPERGTISIEANIVVGEQNMIHIDVIDSGKGIPNADLENIFERFYQLGNKGGNISGGGIGLAFCKSLIELLKGTITVISDPGIETRFSVKVPFFKYNQVDSNMLNTSPRSFVKDFIPLPSISANKKERTISISNSMEHTILIVENEVDVQTFLMSFLSDNYNIIVASNGVEGLDVLKNKEPDLVISDIMMPEMDGFEFCEKIKSNPSTCQIPVLLLTALGDTKDLIKGLEFGADEYISKPFSVKHLELRIEKLISNSIKLKEHFSKNSKIPEANIEMSTRDKEFLESIIEVIEVNISDSTFGVEELANKIGFSPSQFYRKLKQLTGQVPNVYLRNYRLQRAAELLQSNEGYNVAEVMYQIGIESNSYFSTSFKKLYGVSPSEYFKK
jgi:DNA-binding response OmpR family regulator/nitrogen-specific signal transduction histidine kinase